MLPWYEHLVPCGNLVGSEIGIPSTEHIAALGYRTTASPLYSAIQCSLWTKHTFIVQ